ncbi:outer membrane beta-barrel protein [Wenzhouxiangella sp. AB-CW3]|uniref:outer membrane beta-barrel protein n=1 Tax=Wenzhouxiangella sp. AB-CW3 TaxID=2771012 RepID=UPI00168BCD4A|nr:outer membrane beta-barrel protein [Wenzhouxiangella sp. AB-CW3]QOC22305.1 outer membrane beta-barrel protein [Wenzhouxiangella sp. AB-CW3]
MKKHFLALAALAMMAAGPAAAQFDLGIGYHHIDDSPVSVGGLVGSAGYPIVVDENFSVIPELRVGFGINDDTVLGTKVELDHIFGVAARLQYELNESFYGYIVPSYAQYKFSASATSSAGSASISGSTNEFGIGLGLGFRATDTVGLEFAYENVDGSDIISVTTRFSF